MRCKLKRILTFKGKEYTFDEKNNLITEDTKEIDMPQELLDLIDEVKQSMEDRACIPFDDIHPEDMKYYEVLEGSAEEDNLRELGLLWR